MGEYEKGAGAGLIRGLGSFESGLGRIFVLKI